MKTRLVYDLPSRFFHWLFAALFTFAFLIAKTVDDESRFFTYHMLAGLLLTFIVSLRIVWGFFGTRYSRFNSFALLPKDLITYFKGIFSKNKQKWPGHNPASSWAAVIMIFLSLGLGITGYLMAGGQKEAFEDIHEVIANGFLIVVLMHISGVILHTIRYRDGIALSMVNGTKSEVDESKSISNPKPVVAILFLILATSFSAYLAKNFDEQKQSLNFFGKSLQLREVEENSTHK